jgi:glycosyltransferase involved in cell wall biosynthesis
MQLGLDPGKPVCLFVGRFVEKKGLHLLKPIVASTPTVQWLFAGSGPLSPAEWGLPNVRVLSGLSRETLVPLYQAAHLLVLPSRGEGFPLVVQEAFACGTPALVTDETASGLPEASSVLFTCSVDGPDPATRWREAVMSVLGNEEERARRAAAVLACSREHWSWTKSVGAYLDVYGRLGADTTLAADRV